MIHVDCVPQTWVAHWSEKVGIFMSSARCAEDTSKRISEISTCAMRTKSCTRLPQHVRRTRQYQGRDRECNPNAAVPPVRVFCSCLKSVTATTKTSFRSWQKDNCCLLLTATRTALGHRLMMPDNQLLADIFVQNIYCRCATPPLFTTNYSYQHNADTSHFLLCY